MTFVYNNVYSVRQILAGVPPFAKVKLNGVLTGKDGVTKKHTLPIDQCSGNILMLFRFIDNKDLEFQFEFVGQEHEISHLTKKEHE